MDNIEKQLIKMDKERAGDKRMKALNAESTKSMREDTKYYKQYKDKLIELRF